MRRQNTSGRASPRRTPQAAFSLVEVMITSIILVMVTVGAMTVLLKGYKISAEARVQDSSRAVLRTFGDQFLRLATSDRDPDTGATFVRWLFNVTNGFTSQGLVWGELCDASTAEWMSPENLTVPLRGDGDTVTMATITRNVQFVNSSTGNTSQAVIATAAGFQLQGEFRATYVFAGKTYTETLTLLRAVP